MKVILLLIGLLCICWSLATAQDGEVIFRQNCASCHTVGKGKLIGPDLLGVHSKHDEKWLRKFIKSPQTLIAEGDTVAFKLWEENSFIVMPDQSLNYEEVTAVLNFIRQKSEKKEKVAIREPEASKVESRTLFSETFKDFFFTPANWIIGTTFFILLITIWVLKDVVLALSEALQNSKHEKKSQ